VLVHQPAVLPTRPPDAQRWPVESKNAFISAAEYDGAHLTVCGSAEGSVASRLAERAANVAPVDP
jgi:hypothetical protein